jgi:hypothetical protein
MPNREEPAFSSPSFSGENENNPEERYSDQDTRRSKNRPVLKRVSVF